MIERSTPEARMEQKDVEFILLNLLKENGISHPEFIELYTQWTEAQDKEVGPTILVGIKNLLLRAKLFLDAGEVAEARELAAENILQAKQELQYLRDLIVNIETRGQTDTTFMQIGKLEEARLEQHRMVDLLNSLSGAAGIQGLKLNGATMPRFFRQSHTWVASYDWPEPIFE